MMKNVIRSILLGMILWLVIIISALDSFQRSIGVH